MNPILSFVVLTDGAHANIYTNLSTELVSMYPIDVNQLALLVKANYFQCDN